MTKKQKQPSSTAIACVGLLALASAMGIGRFSLTPILPLMQHDAGLSLAQGGWLACGNYLGYLAGALICIVLAPAPLRAIRWGLAGVGLFTLAMGWTDGELLWLASRFLAGLASAFGGNLAVMDIYAAQKNPDTGDQVAAGLGSDRAVLLPNHGVIAVGENLKKAFGAAMAVEESAHVAAIALQLGTPRTVPDAEVDRMNNFIHHKYGQR